MKNSIARDLVEQNGVDSNALVDLLAKTAVSELANYYYYTLLRLNLVGVEGEALKKIVDKVRQEELNHFQALIPRIYELGGTLPANPVDANFGGEGSIGKAVEGEDIRSIVETLLKSAEQSVRAYTQICNLTCGKDNRTYGLALAILHEEIEHQVWFLEFFGHTHGTTLSERVFRTERHASPFVSKYLRSSNGHKDCVVELPVEHRGERRSPARLERTPL